jgi:hypothetical protein
LHRERAVIALRVAVGDAPVSETKPAASDAGALPRSELNVMPSSLATNVSRGN